MKTFDEIYILNLHGNSLKRESTPEGRKDENVFDIRQGVAIAIFGEIQRTTEGEKSILQGSMGYQRRQIPLALRTHFSLKNLREHLTRKSLGIYLDPFYNNKINY